MTKPTLLIIHGMGNHTEQSFKEKFDSTMVDVFKLYPSLSTKTFADFVDVKAIPYNSFFEDYRKNYDGSDNKEKFAQLMQKLPSVTATKIFKKILNLQSDIAGDDFFSSHWLDVLFYRFSTIGTPVQIAVAKAVNQAIQDEGGAARRVHVLGHSLGSAVLHDSLAKLYGESSNDFSDPLSPVTHKLGSLHFVANTSKLLQSFIDVKKSVVKPDHDGCTRRYREYRHSLDPIARVKPFDPTGNGGWIGHYPWEQGYYKLHKLTSVTNQHGNMHSIEHYLFNPKMHLQIFEDVAGIDLPETEISQGKNEFLQLTLQKVAEKAETAFSNISISDKATVAEFVKAYQTLKNFVEDLGGQLDV